MVLLECVASGGVPVVVIARRDHEGAIGTPDGRRQHRVVARHQGLGRGANHRQIVPLGGQTTVHGVGFAEALAAVKNGLVAVGYQSQALRNEQQAYRQAD
jgi:hypothetical protein